MKDETKEDVQEIECLYCHKITIKPTRGGSMYCDRACGSDYQQFTKLAGRDVVTAYLQGDMDKVVKILASAKAKDEFRRKLALALD